MINCEKCHSENVKIVEYKDSSTKKVLVDFVECKDCGHIEYIEEQISKRDLKKKRQ